MPSPHWSNGMRKRSVKSIPILLRRVRSLTATGAEFATAFGRRVQAMHTTGMHRRHVYATTSGFACTGLPVMTLSHPLISVVSRFWTHGEPPSLNTNKAWILIARAHHVAGCFSFPYIHAPASVNATMQV